jgi:type IV fimbrial biogenesis protein FimT
MVVVVIIGVLATIAVPAIAGRLANNRARQVAQEISAIYRNAKMRASGRGSAVLVRYIEASKTFEVREAVMGSASATANVGSSACATLPESSCNPVGRWAVTSEQNLLLENYTYPTDGEYDVSIETPAGNAQNYDVCYTPVGISKGRSAVSPTTLFSTMTGALGIEVKLSSGTGLVRQVIVTPNGMARVVIP